MPRNKFNKKNKMYILKYIKVLKKVNGELIKWK